MTSSLAGLSNLIKTIQVANSLPPVLAGILSKLLQISSIVFIFSMPYLSLLSEVDEGDAFLGVGIFQVSPGFHSLLQLGRIGGKHGHFLPRTIAVIQTSMWHFTAQATCNGTIHASCRLVSTSKTSLWRLRITQ